MDLHLVDQPSLQILLRNVGATAYQDVFVLRGITRSLERRVNAFGHKIKGRSSLHVKRLAWVMGDDKDRHVKGRILSPPAVPWIFFPGAITTAKLATPHYFCPDVLKMFRRDVVIGTCRA